MVILQLPEGQALIMQVPGLLSARLPDDRTAAVINWLPREFAGPSMPAEATPMGAEEARPYREPRPADIRGQTGPAVSQAEQGQPLHRILAPQDQPGQPSGRLRVCLHRKKRPRETEASA
jgi:hypothetical protein